MSVLYVCVQVLVCSVVSLDAGPQRSSLCSPDMMTDQCLFIVLTNLILAFITNIEMNPRCWFCFTSWFEMKCLVYLDRDVTRTPQLPVTS